MKRATIGETRQIALRDGHGQYHGSPCKKDPSHGTLRITNGGSCRECQKIIRQGYGDKFYVRSKDVYIERAAKWAAENPEKAKAAKRKYREDNREELNRKNREYSAANKPKHAAYNRGRWAARMQARVPGYEKQIVAVYEECPEGCCVDHIVPLKGRKVSGLHVPWNLQYLTASENARKHNKFIEDTVPWFTPLDGNFKPTASFMGAY